MSETHFRGRIVQKGLLVKADQVLITRDSRDDVFELPGGRLDVREQPKQGILREIKEELGVEANIERILDLQNIFHARDGEDMVAVYYVLSLVNDTADFKTDPLEVAELKWVDETTYTSYNYFPEYKQALTTYFDSLS